MPFLENLFLLNSVWIIIQKIKNEKIAMLIIKRKKLYEN